MLCVGKLVAYHQYPYYWTSVRLVGWYLQTLYFRSSTRTTPLRAQKEVTQRKVSHAWPRGKLTCAAQLAHPRGAGDDLAARGLLRQLGARGGGAAADAPAGGGERAWAGSKVPRPARPAVVLWVPACLEVGQGASSEGVMGRRPQCSMPAICSQGLA